MKVSVTDAVVDGGKIVGANDAISVVVDHRERLYTSHIRYTQSIIHLFV